MQSLRTVTICSARYISAPPQMLLRGCTGGHKLTGSFKHTERLISRNFTCNEENTKKKYLYRSVNNFCRSNFEYWQRNSWFHCLSKIIANQLEFLCYSDPFSHNDLFISQCKQMRILTTKHSDLIIHHLQLFRIGILLNSVNVT